MDRGNQIERHYPVGNAISKLETVIETAEANELRRKENQSAQVRDEQYQEKVRYDKEKLELTLITPKNWLYQR